MKLTYDFDNARIYHGDARHMTALPPESIQFVCTSPPYFNAREYSTWPTYAAYLSDMAIVWAECYRVLQDGGRIAVNVPMGYDRPSQPGGYKVLEVDTTYALQAAGFEMRGHIVWAKMGLASQNNGTAWGSWMSANNPSLRDGHEVIIIAHKGAAGRSGGESTISRDEFLEYTRSVWEIRPQSQSWHPAPFPSEIPRRLIQLYTFKGDTVLDPFGGSMTTVWEAQKAGRVGIGIELCEDYITQACGGLLMEEAA